ncbi:NADH dehydrogenase, alpha subcomplex, subunit 2 [Cylindrobasidium torrendii FP15055 ss-10]|uniref:NADH dehydrogenase, alpha subcomplex, subunit 2 n=1 Tax=Cylindrobasidium torrendii FP15055 ss-10 TaxID=1314674 RepID=A0A0D7BFY5_9AGAR|nr:NADH dehydrogenase, alpha subcomplex, subunit 2 [Cylindrobasidium torrendii FP15055 ss-10]
MSLAKAFSPALRELRILCCSSGLASAGTRQFVVAKYPMIKQFNPDLPILIREATGTPARVFARFERGRETHVELDGLSAAEVEARVSQLLQ